VLDFVAEMNYKIDRTFAKVNCKFGLEGFVAGIWSPLLSLDHKISTNRPITKIIAF